MHSLHKIGMRLITTSMLVVIIAACSKPDSTPSNSPTRINELASAYFEVYRQRTDFEQFMSFYATNAIFEDIVQNKRFDGKPAIRAFLNWQQGEFSVIGGSTEQASPPILSVHKQVVQGQTAITQGVFHAFTYNGKTMGPWMFVIVQEFNAQGKIMKQSDWINYKQEVM
ncbi:MAG: nuclear transport factor 2 family protein [Glaciecola sp.]